MIPGHFTYLAPASAAAVVDALAEDPEGTTVLGGGTWVVPDMERGMIAPRRVVDLRCAGLAAITCDGGTVRLGAMATYADVLASDVLREHAPLLQTVASGITGGRQLTQQATFGGSAMASRPSSDAPAALVALGATAVLLGPGGERRVAAAELFTGPLATAADPGELLTAFELASTAGAVHGYEKLKRGHSSWPIATAAVVARVDARGRCASVVLALGGVCATPLTVAVDALLVGEKPGAAAVGRAAALAGRAVHEPWGDVLAPASYRAAVARPVAERALAAAFLTTAGTP